MTTEEFSCHSTIYGNLYMTKSSQKGEASIYHIWKRKSTIYGNCNHALAQLFSQVLVKKCHIVERSLLRETKCVQLYRKNFKRRYLIWENLSRRATEFLPRFIFLTFRTSSCVTFQVNPY